MQLPIDVFSDLVVRLKRYTFAIQGDGKVIFLVFPDPGTAIAALRSLGILRTHSNAFLSLLKILDIELDILISGRLVLTFGPGVTPNTVSRLLRIPEGSISLKNLLLCVIPFFRKKRLL
ncbi:MAG: hypothetical protein JW882_21765 [Deltaproteobacteria bacterium]|nr:hypothetical protein [Deltaproteobacteria bacterium]